MYFSLVYLVRFPNQQQWVREPDYVYQVHPVKGPSYPPCEGSNIHNCMVFVLSSAPLQLYYDHLIIHFHIAYCRCRRAMRYSSSNVQNCYISWINFIIIINRIFIYHGQFAYRWFETMVYGYRSPLL